MESNHQPAAYKAAALPIVLTQHGTPRGNRTLNPQIKSLLLCQLSYRSTEMVEVDGVEPTTFCLQSRRSTN